jgi:carbamoyltransferase
VANGKIKRAGIFDDLWIQPAAGDAGGAMGAALAAYHHHFKKPALPKNGRDLLAGSYLGPAYDASALRAFLTAKNIPHTFYDTEEKLLEATAAMLAQEQVVGWFQGRMEFGPRALGNRSILADPRGLDTQKRVNIKIKFREGFRPFAPSVLLEEAPRWFELEGESSYMLLVADVKKERQRPMSDAERRLWGIEKLNVPRSDIPAATHVDYSARIQTVRRDDNPLYHALISAFFKKTGCPVLLNTSFNVRGEPIVESPEDAYRCFMRTGLDALVLGPFLLRKADQPAYTEKDDWQSRYELD